MAGLLPKAPYISPGEYLEIERNAVQKSEYYAGEMFLMAGATKNHNIIGGLHARLKNKPCLVLPSDMRLKVSDTGLYTYPDAMVACDEVLFEDEKEDILLNPVIIVEVLSESTEGYDRGKEFEHYRRIDSFLEYLLIVQDKYQVEHYLKQKDGTWLFSEVRGLDRTLELPTIGCALSLAEIYDKVELGVEE